MRILLNMYLSINFSISPLFLPVLLHGEDLDNADAKYEMGSKYIALMRLVELRRTRY